MSSISFVRFHPISLLSASAVVFGVWVWHDVLRAPRGVAPAHAAQARLDDDFADPTPVRSFSKKPFPGAQRPERLSPREVARALTRIRPGMTRADVEGVVGLPAPVGISPTQLENSRVAYRTTYEADLRPLPAGDSDTAARTVVTLEFDATRVGHPLVAVVYPDPLY